MSSIRLPRRARAPIAIVLTLASVGAWILTRGAPLHAEDAAPHEHGHDGHAMDDAAMQRWVRDWYAAHPAHPATVGVAGAPADTFIAAGFTFDADQNGATVEDTVHVFAGQAILWKWSIGIHTTTNGTGALDPLAGMLWDIPLDSTSPEFARRFDVVGAFPFFCRPHEGFNMKGAVIVAAPADTFLANGFAFDTDGNAGTQVDTVFIFAGQAVMWREVSGIHTVTSGTGALDPNVGALFDVPLDTSNPVFTFVFNSPGTFPFFCRQHEGFNMRGVVVVKSTVGVEPIAGVAGDGFLSAPWPSPTRAGVSFRFALRRAGPVRAEVLDAGGRRVALVAEGPYPAGAYLATWDGRGIHGDRVAAGVYYLRLALPGFSSSRRIVVVR
jgi:plastocyanin